MPDHDTSSPKITGPHVASTHVDHDNFANLQVLVGQYRPVDVTFINPGWDKPRVPIIMMSVPAAGDLVIVGGVRYGVTGRNWNLTGVKDEWDRDIVECVVTLEILG